MKNEMILSAGIDIGTTTTHLIISRIGISVTGGFGAIPSAQITHKEIIYKSPVYFTPLNSQGLIDGKAVAEIIADEYKNAGVCKDELKSGAVIITGESSKKENAHQVINDISDLAGSFVAAQAGSELESYLAGKGAGADILSEASGLTVANIDIGGGTTNISIFENGECIDDCCLNIGGRLIKKENDGSVYVAPSVKKLCSIYGISEPKEISSTDAIKSICKIMAEIIKTALGFGNKEIPPECVTDHLPGKNHIPDAVMFSGGVAECMGKSYEDFAFGDAGVLLAKAIEKSAESYPCRMIKNDSCSPIRATVIGAGNFSMEISGSTINFNSVEFPLKNLECIKDLNRIKAEPCAICIDGEQTPSFEYVSNLADKIISASAAIINNGIPLVVITKYDFSKALGQCIKRRLPENYPFICADGIDCKKGDYIDIGNPVANGKAVPVIVKTLVFGG